MAILRRHLPYYRQIFAMPGFFAEPILLFGHQDHLIELEVSQPLATPPPGRGRLAMALDEQAGTQAGLFHPDLEIPAEYLVADLSLFLRNRGLQDLRVVDLFDPRADLRWDMNLPVPETEHDRYGTVIDVGSLEHVFDTRQCIENCLRLVRPGGHYMLHTCVNGYHRHGLHTFNPEALLLALDLNGFEIVFHAYSTKYGAPLKDPSLATDALIWLVGRKIRTLDSFVNPQQGRWRTAYDAEPPGPETPAPLGLRQRLKSLIRWSSPPALLAAYRWLRHGLRWP